MEEYITRKEALEAIENGLKLVYTNSDDVADILVGYIPAEDVIPVDWILKYSTEKDKDGDTVFVRNNIDTMLEKWRERNG